MGSQRRRSTSPSAVELSRLAGAIRLFALPRRAGFTGLSVTYAPLHERSFAMASAAWGMWS